MTDKPLVPTPDALTRGRAKPDIVEVPARTVLSVDGAGAPGDASFVASVGALYGIAYTMRFARKGSGRAVFKVGPLEGEWRAVGAHVEAGRPPEPGTWRWTLRMAVPDDATEGEVGAAAETVARRRASKGPDTAAAGVATAVSVELTRLEPARFARILHVGPYASEPESFAKIEAFLESAGETREPWHIEVYLSDPGRTVPEKLKTVLLTKVP